MRHLEEHGRSYILGIGKHPKWHVQMEQLLAANHLKRPHDQLSEEVARSFMARS